MTQIHTIPGTRAGREDLMCHQSTETTSGGGVKAHTTTGRGNNLISSAYCTLDRFLLLLLHLIADGIVIVVRIR